VCIVCVSPQVKPLRRQLKTLKAWITGQRKDQSPGTRMAVPVVEVDPVFEGEGGGAGEEGCQELTQTIGCQRR